MLKQKRKRSKEKKTEKGEGECTFLGDFLPINLTDGGDTC